MGSYKKKLFIVLLLSLLISFFVCSSAKAVNYYQTDETYKIEVDQLLKDQQEYLSSVFINYLEKIGTTEQKDTFKSYLNNENYSFFFHYIGNASSTDYIEVVFYLNNTDFSKLTSQSSNINTHDDYFEDSFFNYPVTGYNINQNLYLFRYFFSLPNGSIANTSATSTKFLPSCLIYYQNETCKNYLNGINPNSSSIAMIMQKIEENTSATEDVKEEMQKMNNFLNSDDVEENSYSMPSNSDNPTQDVTADGVNNIFNQFYSAVTNWTSPSINVPIPFTGESFVIPANTTENALKKFSGQGFGAVLKYLINLVWYYLLGRYIVKDVAKYIDGLKTGEILTKSDTNIKTEML